MTSLSTYTNNITNYINKKTSITNIKFMFFNANDLKQPKMKDTFKLFSIDNKNCYIINGEHNNYWYIYYETNIQYLVNIIGQSIGNNNCIIYNIDLVEQGSTVNHDVNHGNHIDFGLIKLRSGNTVVKTHKTIYTDLGNLVFDRDTPTCNFIFKVDTLTNFENIACERLDGSICGYLSLIYNQFDKEILRHMCSMMTTTHGGRKIRKKHVGGDIIFSNEVIKLISDVILKPVYELRKDLMEVRLFYEDNKNIVIIFDFIDYTMSIMCINARKLFEMNNLNNSNNEFKMDIQKIIDSNLKIGNAV